MSRVTILTRRSRARVVELLTPSTAITKLQRPAPQGLTIKHLLCYKRYRRLRDTYTIARISCGELVPLSAIRQPGGKYYFYKEVPPPFVRPLTIDHHPGHDVRQFSCTTNHQGGAMPKR